MENEKQMKDFEVQHLSKEEKKILLDWAKNVKTIQKDKNLNFNSKINALKELNNSGAFRSSTKFVTSKTKHYWKNASWSERLGIIGGSGALAIAGFGGAGIAALGGAVGLPLFLVTAAGGTLIGTIIDKLDK